MSGQFFNCLLINVINMSHYSSEAGTYMCHRQQIYFQVVSNSWVSYSLVCGRRAPSYSSMHCAILAYRGPGVWEEDPRFTQLTGQHSPQLSNADVCLLWPPEHPHSNEEEVLKAVHIQDLNSFANATSKL